MKKIILRSIATLMLVGHALAIDPIFTPFLNNLAIRGYDPVAYFTQNKPIEGMASYEYEWMGATWRFASAEHKDLFVNDPEAYAPQYGGYCAYAVASNSTASIEPEQFSIVDGKLYLNYNRKVQEKWLKDQARFIEEADKYWPELVNK